MASSHAQIFLKRPVSDSIPSGNTADRGDQSSAPKDLLKEADSKRVVDNASPSSKQSEGSWKSDERRSGGSQYEIKEVQSADGSPIKVIELKNEQLMSPVGNEPRQRLTR